MPMCSLNTALYCLAHYYFTITNEQKVCVICHSPENPEWLHLNGVTNIFNVCCVVFQAYMSSTVVVKDNLTVN